MLKNSGAQFQKKFRPIEKNTQHHPGILFKNKIVTVSTFILTLIDPVFLHPVYTGCTKKL